MKKFLFGLLAAACTFVSCDEIASLIDGMDEGNQLPTMVESEDGLQTTISFNVVGVVKYSYVVEFAVSKGDTLCTKTTLTEDYTLSTLADQAWNTTQGLKQAMQDEYEALQDEIETTTDKEERDLLIAQAQVLQQQITNFNLYHTKNGNKITSVSTEFAGISKKDMRDAMNATLAEFKKLYDEFANVIKAD